jgi:hypothetical protein
MRQYRWEREKQSEGLRWYLAPIGGGNPVAAIVPNDPESRRLRYRAEVSFSGHGRGRDWASAAEARGWVEQTLTDWAEWRGCKVKKLFAFSERQRGIATTIIVVGALIGFAAVLFITAAERFWVPSTEAVEQGVPAPARPVSQPTKADCRPLVRAYRTAGWVSHYPPFSVWWGQSVNIVYVYDDGRGP